jgi:hypothetical protein
MANWRYAHGMWKSIRDFFLAMCAAWWGMIPGFVGTIVGAIQAVSATFVVPPWAAWAISIVGFWCAAFWAYHKMRIERDELRAKLDSKDRIAAVARTAIRRVSIQGKELAQSSDRNRNDVIKWRDRAVDLVARCLDQERAKGLTLGLDGPDNYANYADDRGLFALLANVFVLEVCERLDELDKVRDDEFQNDWFMPGPIVTGQ